MLRTVPFVPEWCCSLTDTPILHLPQNDAFMKTVLRIPEVVLLLCCVFPSRAHADEKIDFNRDVRPIISDNCFQCHGPDAKNQESDFRLNERASAIADLGGYAGVVPGELERSEMHSRIHDDDPDIQMPPEDSKLSLTDRQRDILDRWIQEGAPYDKHWSFKPVTIPALPPVKSNDWISNPIDHFVLAELEKQGLQPSVEAEKARLLRRVTFDLTGLPPTLEELDNFLADQNADAWEKVVDRLLASSSYGERMALVWLDASRYADSGGYQNDIKRSQWPWRDWVINAYNDNMPFDQFTIEQLAGDLLDDSTDQQRLATAFNRNHRINNEGGIIAQEFQVEYVADRVETTSTVWLGLTVGCARCHDHKFDPISQKDFYRMFAFFNHIAEYGRDGNIAPAPNMVVYKNDARENHAQLKERVASLRKQVTELGESRQEDFRRWIESRSQAETLQELASIPAASMHLTFDSLQGKRAADTRDSKRRIQLVGRRKDADPTDAKFGGGVRIGDTGLVKVIAPHGKGFAANKPYTWIVHVKTPKSFAGSEGPLLSAINPKTGQGYRLMLEEGEGESRYRMSCQIIGNSKQKKTLEVVSEAIIVPNTYVRIGVRYDGSEKAAGVQLFVNGKPVNSNAKIDQLQWQGISEDPLLIGARSEQDAKENLRDATLRGAIIDDVQLYESELSAEQVATLCKADPIDVVLANSNEVVQQTLLQHFLTRVDSQQERADLKKAEADLQKFENQLVRVSIMQEMPEPRTTHLLRRGVYDQPDTTETLEPNTLSSLPAMDQDLPRNRLGLAKWLVDPQNPLTARVAVNRYWQMYFGTGLVNTPEDFGSQGANATHPELLDWLAGDFVRSGWNVKRMQKQIVMSATYRQSSRVTRELLKKDPANRSLARGPRFRLYGQALRDQALAVSGMLSEKMGGPPVMPYQPAGLWDEVSAKGYKYVVGNGSDLYRRSLYTFWRRTVPPPSMMNFDNSAREMCSVRPSRTNTPLQAMNLMNDPQFVEAARKLAERILIEGGESAAEQIRFGHRVVLSQDPNPKVAQILESAFKKYALQYSADPHSAEQLLSIGESEVDGDLKHSDLAAMTAIANILLNLDETVTKE